MDREGKRPSFSGLRTVLNFIQHPILNIQANLASSSWTPTLKKGDTYNGSIVIRKSNHNLYYYDNNGKLLYQTQVSTGKNPGLKQKEGDSRTPVGKFSIQSYESLRDPNHFGHNRFLRLNTGQWQGIGIHGDANQPYAIGTNASHGCIRLPNDAIVKLTDMLGGHKTGTPVYILDEEDKYKRGGKLIPKHLLGN